MDDIGLPVDNPWRRAIRMSDVQFLKDGTGVGVTLDGDVWLICGFDDPSGSVRWRRFASGLHEPLTLAIRDEQIYVFDRNGIWRIRDTNGDGKRTCTSCSRTPSRRLPTCASSRAPSGLRPAAISSSPRGINRRRRLESTTDAPRVSADGKRITQLGYGFRQPNISVNPKTGLVLASDQQGNYIPSTPLHVVRDNHFYGFLKEKLPREVYPAPIAVHHLGSAHRERVRNVPGLDIRREDGSAQRRPRPDRVQ